MSATTGPDVRMTASPPPGLAGAEPWRRVAARLIDHVGLSVAAAVLLAPIGLGTAVLGGPAGHLAVVASAVLVSALTVGYFALLEAQGGRTLGKRALGLRVVDAYGVTPALGATLRRNAWTGLGVVSVVPLVGDVLGAAATTAAALTILFQITRDGDRRGWHDSLAGGTRVVRGS
jgi:uncharacterized RDD family membrane protein YckC